PRFLRYRAETAELEADFILAGRQRLNCERARCISDRGARALQCGRGGGDSDPRNREVLSVLDEAADRSGLNALCKRIGREAKAQHERKTVSTQTCIHR